MSATKTKYNGTFELVKYQSQGRIHDFSQEGVHHLVMA